MKILVIGAAGMLGRKLIDEIASGALQASGLIRQDVVLSPPPPSARFNIDTFLGDLSVAGEAEKLVASRPDLIFHLAAIVSGEAEADFETLMERATCWRPFASKAADMCRDWCSRRPLLSLVRLSLTLSAMNF
jgi:nucleoside-diphosphate-sugar epimerase